MTKKSGAAFVIVAYLAMGVTGSVAYDDEYHHHHHHHHNSDDQTDKDAARIDALAAQCFKECDFARDLCDASPKAKTFCSELRTECQQRCSAAAKQ